MKTSLPVFLLVTIGALEQSCHSFQFLSINENLSTRNSRYGKDKSLVVHSVRPSDNELLDSNDDFVADQNLSSKRRNVLGKLVSAPLLVMSSIKTASAAVTPTGPNDGNLVDLPPDAVRSYLQYRIQLQIAADFYIFDLQDQLKDVDDWGEIGQLFRVNNNRGQGQPSRIEREFVNPMRILGLSMPPDIAEEMQISQDKFDQAMAKIGKVVQGVRRDLPIEIDTDKAIPQALNSWDEGRLALNNFFIALNDATGLNEMKTIPPMGPNQFQEYGRSIRRYNDLVKKTKLCQNRGGPTLSQAWGQLMVSGYLQDSCGLPDFNEYFYQ